MRLYLAGPMTGLQGFNFPAFHAAAVKLRYAGFEVFNPAETDFGKPSADVTHREALAVDLAWIITHAEAIALLPGWHASKGARAEFALATALDLKIIYWEEFMSSETARSPYAGQKAWNVSGITNEDIAKIDGAKRAITEALNKTLPLASDPMTKHKLLDMAKQATADRGLNYGKPEDNFNRIAARWRVHLLNRYGVKVDLDAASIAIMLNDMKLARLENAPDHVDSWVDAAGYIACGAEIACK